MKTRMSYQKGWVEKKEHGYLLRCRIPDPTRSSGWRTKSKFVRGCTSRRKAEKLLAGWLEGILESAKGESPEPSPVLFCEFVAQDWFPSIRHQGIAETTVYSWESHMDRHLHPAFGARSIQDITTRDISAFMNSKSQYSAQTRRHFYTVLKLIFDRAVESELLEKSPIRPRLHRPRVDRAEKPTLTVAQLQRVLQEIPAPWRLLFETLAVTGLRAGEVLGLQWRDVDWQGDGVRLCRGLWRGKVNRLKTEASRGFVALPPTLLARLEALRSQSRFQGLEDFIFCYEDGRPWDPNYLRKKVLYPALKRAKIERGTGTHGLHLFRHTAGSLVHEQTGSLKRAQQLLRHSRIETTADTYVHVGDQASRDSAQLLSQALETCPPICRPTGPESPYVN